MVIDARLRKNHDLLLMEFLRLQPQNVTPYYSPVVEHAPELMLEPE